MNLESKLYKTSRKLLISYKQRSLIKRYTDLLKEHHPPTDEHSGRMALKAVELADAMGMGINAARALYYGTRLHDIGKICVAESVLDKKDFDEDKESKDMGEVIPHSQMGYLMLKDSLPFTAMICLLHHSYKKDGYPNVKKLDSKINMGKVHRYARIVSLIDCYDKITNMPNTPGKKLSKSEKMQKMSDIYRDATMSKMINLYFSAGVFK